jgi:hypothetical protein
LLARLCSFPVYPVSFYLFSALALGLSPSVINFLWFSTRPFHFRWNSWPMCSPFLTGCSRLQLVLPTAQHELTHLAVRPRSTSGRSSWTYKGHYCHVELWSPSLPTLLILKQWILGLMWFLTSSCPPPDTSLQHNSVPLLLGYLCPGVDFINTISQVIQGLSLLLLLSHSTVLWPRWQLQTACDSAPVGCRQGNLWSKSLDDTA